MTPFYLRKIGLDGLGLIGLMALAGSVLGVFVVGATRTYQRDLSTAQSSAPQDLSGLVKGGTLIFTLLGGILGLLILFLGHGQIHQIAEGTRFSTALVKRCVWIISMVLALGIAAGALGSTLMALKDHVWLQTATVIVTLITAAASWLTLSSWPRVDVFYLCQLGGGVLTTIILTLRCRFILRRDMADLRPRSMREAWSARAASSGKLSLSLIVHEGIGILITQIDRLLVTSRFPVTALGTYNLGASPARFAGLFTSPVTTVTYPELCQMVNRHRSPQETGEYLGRITFVLFLIMGAGLIVVAPSAQSLLELWLGAGHVPPDTAACLILLTCGQLLQASAGPSYNLTVAHGRVGYGITKNIVCLFLLPLAAVLAIKLWGLPGVTVVGIVYGLISLVVCATMAFHRHADIQSACRWLGGMATSLIVSLCLTGILMMSGLHGWMIIILSVLCACLFITAFLVIFFGFNPSAWLHLLEVNTRNEPSPPATLST